MATVFRRTWWLDSAPTNAILQVRAFGGCQVTLNNALVGVALRAGENWKKPTVYDVGGLLRAGANEISVAVTKSHGPPALWLSLKSGTRTLNSDETWQTSLCGAVWQPARLASTPMPIRPGNRLADGERCVESLLNRLPTLLLFAGLSLGILCGAKYLWHGRNARADSGRTKPFTSPPIVLVLLAVGLWISLFAHNLRLLPALNGFDVDDHLEYIQYIRQWHALPLPNEGGEMHHPPLYYLLCAAVLSVFHLATRDAAGIMALRCVGLILGLAQLGLVFASLRLVFPHDVRKQTVGLTLAAFMPVTLYLYHYVTNEILAATLVTASIYYCLRIVSSERAEVGLHAALGLCLGAALLSKISVLAVAPVILGTLAGRLLILRERNLWQWLRTVGLTFLVCLVVSGWHYLRLWARFGNAVFTYYDQSPSGFAYWLDPGYGTAAFYARFGQALRAPLFSGFNSVANGFYSTLWGDGLCGGVSNLLGRPPWNYDLMAAGYLLALLPTAAVLVGAIAVFISLIRQARVVWLLLGGVALTMGMALIWQLLRSPGYSSKAFYGLPALLPLCAFGAWGTDILTRRWPIIRVAVWIGLGTWAMNSYASLWIQTHAPGTRIAFSQELEVRGNFTAAVEGLQDVLRGHPQNVVARLALARTLKEMGHTEEAWQQYESAWRSNSHDPDCVAAMAYTLAERGQSSEAIRLSQQVVQDAPDRPDMFPLLGSLLAQQQQFDKAVAAYEEALRISPDDFHVHSDLGTLNLRLGRYRPAIEHFLLAVQITPDDSVALNRLARLLATLTPQDGGDPVQAVTLAERACGLTGNRVVSYLDTLAAAYAGAGRFTEAMATAQKAIELARAAGQPQVASEIETYLELYRGGHPCRQPQTPVRGQSVDPTTPPNQ